MKRQFWLIPICLIIGCSGKNSGKTLLPENQMVKILWDMIQVDELATARLARDTGKDPKKERIQLYQKVFQLHKISEKQFSNSLTYYSGHPDLMKVMFDTLEARGTRERKNSYLHKDSLPK
ncbi:MAG: DUF4296 domain-containing protein [Chitinophagaceae bacterium]